MVDPAAPNCNTLVDLAIYPIHVSWTMKRCGVSTHPCWSPTPTVNDRDLTLLTRTQTSEQEYSDLTASNRHPSTPYTHNTPQSFSRGIWLYAFLRLTSMCRDIFDILPRFLKNLVESEILVCSVTAGMKNALGMIQLWFSYFAASFEGTWQCKC